MPFQTDSEIKTGKETEIRVETETETETETSEMNPILNIKHKKIDKIIQWKKLAAVLQNNNSNQQMGHHLGMLAIKVILSIMVKPAIGK